MPQTISTPEEAVQIIPNGSRVFVQGSAATPLTLLNALLSKDSGKKDIELVSISTLGEINTEEIVKDRFFFNALFVSANIRKAVNSGYGGYIPVFLSEIHRLFDDGILPLDVALVHVSPPDNHGFCSLGVSVDVARAALRNAKIVIAQVNPNMPRTHGDGFIHESRIDYSVMVDDELPQIDYSSKAGEAERKIAGYCAELIDDGATLQMGIGVIPDAVLKKLTGHKNLGIHTEMLSNGLLPLVESGVINNTFKKKHRNKVVTAFAVGNKKLYQAIHDNPQYFFLEASYVNDPQVISKNPDVVAINSAIEIDLTGQVCSDSLGTFQYSGVGGQMDFLRAAAISPGGKPIIAMCSVTRSGESKIVPMLKPGAGVVTTRAHVHYVITEYGTAFLFGKNLKQRAQALAAIAHPRHREWLEREINERF
jgi:acyl-CoA hydrolase